MYFENYGHIISPNEMKMVSWDLVSKKLRVNQIKERRTDIDGPPVGTIEVDGLKYSIRGWRLIHRLFKEFDDEYNLSIPELKSLAYELLIEEGVFFYDFINGMLQDSDPTKKFLVMCEENNIVGF